mgnify:CR=1 FL=1
MTAGSHSRAAAARVIVAVAADGQSRSAVLPDAQAAHEHMVEMAAEASEDLMEAYLEEGDLTQEQLIKGLRLGTRKSGCTGYAYVVDYADDIAPDDKLFESHGVTVVVDGKSLPNIDGMEVDYVRNNLLNEGFEFRNPNVTEACGCGESFSV